MKSDLTWKNIRLKANQKQIRQFKGTSKERQGELQQRESMCQFMRILQKKERGALEQQIEKEQKHGVKATPLFRDWGGNSWNGSLIQSRRLSRCIIHAENDKAICDTFAQRQAQKSLIIKNLHLSPTSNKELMKTPKKQAQSQKKQINIQLDSLCKPYEQFLQKSKRQEFDRFKSRLFNAKYSQRVKTEEDINKICLDNRHHKKKHLFPRKSQQNSLQTLNKMNIGLSKSIALNEIPTYLKSRMHTQGDDQIQRMEKQLFNHQNDYLKIKRLEKKVNGSKLYHTQNPNVIESPDLATFRRYGESQYLQ